MSFPVFLIGARGCGKTTVGRAVAEALDYVFIDTDHYIQQASGQTISEIVAIEGWSEFRTREVAALRAVTAQNSVIATGGGIVLDDSNQHYMREQGIVIWLHAPAEALATRLAISPQEMQRPSLTGKPLLEELDDILAQRTKLYRKSAHYIIDATQSSGAIVQEVMRLICSEPIN